MVNVRMLVRKGLILGVLVAVPPAVNAQMDTSYPSQPRLSTPKRGMKVGNEERRMQHLTERLNLTAEQQEQIRPILEDETAKVNGLRADENLSRVQRRAKQQEIRDQMYDRINAVLTPEQQKRHDELRKQAQKRRIDRPER